MTQDETYYTLITGGSMGIGKAIAIECAGRGMNLILVALEGPELDETASEIRSTFPVDVRTFSVDLTEKDGPETVFRYCESEDLRINMLINNAGRGNSGFMESNSLEDYRSIMDLNNRAMVELTYFFLPGLKKLSRSYILNTSSMEATLPLPYKTVYTSTKHFIYGFSLALREEVAHTGLKVSVLCPGSVVTNEEGMQRIEAHGARAKLIVMFPDKVARIAIKRLLEGKRVIIPGFMPNFIVKTMNMVPTGMKMRILERLFRVYKEK